MSWSCPTCGQSLDDLTGEPITERENQDQMILYVVFRSETEWQELVGVYSTKEKADAAAEANAKHYHTVGPLSEMYHKGCDLCHVTEVALDKP